MEKGQALMRNDIARLRSLERARLGLYFAAF
jgi:hypothetical protein